MAYKINGTTVVDNSRNVCACCVTSCCITASTRMDAPSGTTAQRPSSPATGSLYFDTDEGSLLSYDGTDWAAVGGAAAGIEVTNAVNSSCDAWATMTINPCCCTTSTGGSICSACWCCATGFKPTALFNVTYATNCACCHTSETIVSGGYNYHVWSYYYGTAPCHVGRIFGLNGENLGYTSNGMIGRYAIWHGVPSQNGLACKNMSNMNVDLIGGQNIGGQAYACCVTSMCRNWIKPGIQIYPGRGEVSFISSHDASNTKFCNYCSAYNTVVEEYINNKGGVSRREGTAQALPYNLCTSCPCLTLKEAYGPHYYPGSAWGPSPHIMGSLCCYGGNNLRLAIYTATEDTYGTNQIEICDFAYDVCCNWLTGPMCSYAGCNQRCRYAHMPWNVGSCLQGSTSTAIRFSNYNAPHPCCLCGGSCCMNPQCVFNLISKKPGFNVHNPASYVCCVSGESCNGVDVYRTNHASCGAWMVSFKSCPDCSTAPYCATPYSNYGSCNYLKIMSKDKCCIDFIINNSLGNNSCLCCTPYISHCWKTSSGTLCCKFLCKLAVELVSLNLVTGTVTNCGYIKGLCTLWMYPHCCNGCNLCTNGIVGGENAVEYWKNGFSSSGFECIQSIMPMALGAKILDSDGIWSCNCCFLYIPQCADADKGVMWSVWDGANKRYLCSINIIYALQSQINDAMACRMHNCYAGYWADACFKSFICNCVGVPYTYFPACECSWFMTMGIFPRRTTSQLSCCIRVTHGNWTENCCCNFGYGNGTHSNSSFVNPTNDHLVSFVKVYDEYSSTEQTVLFEGFICYDLNNKCVSKFNGLFPQMQQRLDCAYSFTSNCNSKNGEIGGSAKCYKSDVSARFWATPDCSCMGYTFINYHSTCRCEACSPSSNYYGFFKTYKSGCCAGSPIGCTGIGSCVCANTAYSSRMSVHRIPMDKPMECAGLNCDCDITKLLQGIFGHGPWANAIYSCCATLCTDCKCAAYYRPFTYSMSTGSSTGLTDPTCCHKWCYWHTMIAFDSQTACLCWSCGACYNGSCTGTWRVCDDTRFGCKGLTESRMYKGLSASVLPNDSTINNMMDPVSTYSANPTDQTELVASSGAATVFPFCYACGDVGTYTRICRYYKEKLACIC